VYKSRGELGKADLADVHLVRIVDNLLALSLYPQVKVQVCKTKGKNSTMLVHDGRRRSRALITTPEASSISSSVVSLPVLNRMVPIENLKIQAENMGCVELK